MNFYTIQRMQSHIDSKAPAEVRAGALAAEAPKESPIPVNKRIQKNKAHYAA